jgi:beta-ribofuranosylaminobenzene 5'-phosphate synthase
VKRVIVTTPARLHFGLIDMNGEIGRIDGGVGLALESPHTVIEAMPSKGIQVDCRDEPGMVDRVKDALENVCTAYGLDGAYVNVKERPLPHVGLGSATQALVGAAHAACRLHGIQKPSRELATLVGRGGTSGIGVAAVEDGGFIVDGGHRFRRGQHDKQEYMPSGASVGIDPPPVLARCDFPDWDVLVVVPLGKGASGLREVALFKIVCPIPIEQVRQMCHILLMQMMPAVAEKDLESFGQAMEAFQELGFKVFELRAQTNLPGDCLTFLRENGGMGVGMSSWGPAVYAFGEDLSSLWKQSREWLDSHGGGVAVLTKANNRGMRIVEEE